MHRESEEENIALNKQEISHAKQRIHSPFLPLSPGYKYKGKGFSCKMLMNFQGT